MPAFWLGAAIGPVLAGRLFDHYGDYRVALWTIIGMLGFTALATLTLPRFERNPAH